MPKRGWRDPPADYTAFARDSERLRKTFKSFDVDLEDIKRHLSEHACEREGRGHQPVPGWKGNVWKYRQKNSDKAAGEGFGYRFLYFAHATDVVPLRMYDKSERDTVPTKDGKKAVAAMASALAAEDAAKARAAPKAKQSPAKVKRVKKRKRS